MGLQLRRGHAPLSTEMDRPVALAAAKTDGETSPNVAGSSRGYFELLPDEGTDGGGGSRQRQHQSSAPPWPRLSRHELSAAEGATLGRHKDRIRRFSESRVVCALLHIVVQNQILEIGLINYSAWFVSWVASSFVFGAICIGLEESVSGFTPSAWGSFVHIRERLSPFLRLSLLLLVLVVVTEGVSMVLGTGVFWLLHRLQVHRTGFLIMAVSYVAVGLGLLVASRFFLAVPAVILDDYSIGRAMLRSDELTRGKWLVLAALLAKSLIGGYVAGMCPFWLASFVRVSVPLPSWFPWILTGASVIAVSVVEPTMFIGFALLYLKMSPTPCASQAQNAGHVANSIFAATHE